MRRLADVNLTLAQIAGVLGATRPTRTDDDFAWRHVVNGFVAMIRGSEAPWDESMADEFERLVLNVDIVDETGEGAQ